MSLELLQQWIFGNLEGFGDSRDFEAASIVRIIVAGRFKNSFIFFPKLKSNNNF